MSLPFNKNRKFTEEQFKNAVKDSLSIREVLQKLGLKAAGANYKMFHGFKIQLNLCTKHFTGQGYLKGRTHDWAKKIPLKQILVENSSYKGTFHRLKIRLCRDGHLIKKCYECGITEWLEKPLSLHLHHKNGINNDHRLENLSLLCPNCHSLTENYCGKNKCSY